MMLINNEKLIMNNCKNSFIEAKLQLINYNLLIATEGSL